MADSAASTDKSAPRTVRDIADSYVSALTDLDPILATSLGVRPGEDRLPDLSPSGQQAVDDLARSTLANLPNVNSELAGDERRCARLLRERLEAGLAMSAQGENLRAVSNIFGPPHRIRGAFLDMPVATEDDWAVIARRMAKVGQALAEYQASLTEGARRGMLASPRVVRACAEQMEQWAAAGGGRGWFAEFAAAAEVPAALRAELDAAAAGANEATGALARWLGTVYLPQADGTQDGVGADRYRVCARRWREPTWTRGRHMPGAGPSSSICKTRCAPRPISCSLVRRLRKRCTISRRTARPSTASRRSGPGCRR